MYGRPGQWIFYNREHIFDLYLQLVLGLLSMSNVNALLMTSAAALNDKLLTEFTTNNKYIK